METKQTISKDDRTLAEWLAEFKPDVRNALGVFDSDRSRENRRALLLLLHNYANDADIREYAVDELVNVSRTVTIRNTNALNSFARMADVVRVIGGGAVSPSGDSVRAVLGVDHANPTHPVRLAAEVERAGRANSLTSRGEFNWSTPTLSPASA